MGIRFCPKKPFNGTEKAPRILPKNAELILLRIAILILVLVTIILGPCRLLHINSSEIKTGFVGWAYIEEPAMMSFTPGPTHLVIDISGAEYRLHRKYTHQDLEYLCNEVNRFISYPAQIMYLPMPSLFGGDQVLEFECKGTKLWDRETYITLYQKEAVDAIIYGIIAILGMIMIYVIVYVLIVSLNTAE